MKKLLIIVFLMIPLTAPAGLRFGSSGGSSSITGGTCTNQVATAIDTSGVPTCTTVAPSYMDLTAAYAFSNATNTYKGASYTDNSADPADSGVLRCGNNVVCMAAEASPAGPDITWTPTTGEQWQSSAPVLVPDGSAASPGLGFAGDSTTGIYGGSGAVRFSVSGTQVGVLVNNKLEMLQLIQIDRSTFDQIALRTAGTYIGSLANGSVSMGISTTVLSTYTSGTKTLTDNTATTFAKVTMTSDSNAGGTIHFTIEDTTTRGSIAGHIDYAAIDAAGTITCGMSTVSATSAIGGSAGFALTSITCADAGSNVLNLNATALTTGGTDALRIKYTIIQNNSQVVTPQ